MNYKKVEAVSKGPTNVLINGHKIRNEAKYFLSGIFKIIWYLYQLKNTFHILAVLFGLIPEV